MVLAFAFALPNFGVKLLANELDVQEAEDEIFGEETSESESEETGTSETMPAEINPLPLPLPVGPGNVVTPFVPILPQYALKDSAYLQSLIDASGGRAVITIEGDTYLHSQPVFIRSGMDITIIGAGHLYASGLESAFVVEYGGRLVLDSDYVLINGASSVNGFVVEYGAVLELHGGIVEGFHGNGVLVNSGGTFYMYGGAIRGNLVAGVDNSGVFTMHNGEIHNNADSGVIVGRVEFFGEFTMYGGQIHHNTSVIGAGVRIVNGIFTKNYGEIHSNIAVPDPNSALPLAADGAGVRVGLYGTGATGTFYMHGGRIFNNISLSTLHNAVGGGVSVVEVGMFTMTGGSIDNNEAQNGGGIGHSGGAALLQTTVDSAAFVIDNTARNGGGASNTYWTLHGDRIRPVTSAAYAPNPFNNHDILASGFLVELFNVETGYRGEGWYELGEAASVYPGTKAGHEFSHWTVSGHAVIPFSVPNRIINVGYPFPIVQATEYVNFPVDPVAEPFFTMEVIPASGSIQFHAHWTQVEEVYNRIIFEISDIGVSRPHHYPIATPPSLDLGQYTLTVEVGHGILGAPGFRDVVDAINALSPNIVRNGYRLSGWFTRDIDGVLRELNNIHQALAMPEGNPVVFVAEWEPIAYQITYRFVDNGGNPIPYQPINEIVLVTEYNPETLPKNLQIPKIENWIFERFEVNMLEMGLSFVFDVPEGHPNAAVVYQIPQHINDVGIYGDYQVVAIFRLAPNIEQPEVTPPFPIRYRFVDTSGNDLVDETGIQILPGNIAEFKTSYIPDNLPYILPVPDIDDWIFLGFYGEFLGFVEDIALDDLIIPNEINGEAISGLITIIAVFTQNLNPPIGIIPPLMHSISYRWVDMYGNDLLDEIGYKLVPLNIGDYITRYSIGNLPIQLSIPLLDSSLGYSFVDFVAFFEEAEIAGGAAVGLIDHIPQYLGEQAVRGDIVVVAKFRRVEVVEPPTEPPFEPEPITPVVPVIPKEETEPPTAEIPGVTLPAPPEIIIPEIVVIPANPEPPAAATPDNLAEDSGDNYEEGPGGPAGGGLGQFPERPDASTPNPMTSGNFDFFGLLTSALGLTASGIMLAMAAKKRLNCK